MPKIITELLTPLLAVIAALVSVISLFHTKRAIYSNIIAAKRFEWMESLRNKYTEFIRAYCDETLSASKKTAMLTQKKFEIELYFDNRCEEYQEISRELDGCIDCVREDGVPVIPEGLIEAIQRTFSNTHKRAKREAGITKAMENRMRRNILGAAEKERPGD